mmetsp:Transcript_13836/g.32277  ORF Transcript_13836/g.32277 Transcript_13836/m.32277 type:complete len:282 (-) Transcript_13836:156-1001(-)|eukprot:CAMPEP_0197180412 /NCGR_PEP_ID=MMETSP1423-20130617/5040_1 /TAXON_ID=476441 /ORGANISM="Pseudo-nitzschia heimii, Strain UNC1101" /LENGTH=281 /DNA_ID=CAMNT_0042630489 /DNA_START=289 /DNA_END=1134 /DNA_ORIENTATION=+
MATQRKTTVVYALLMAIFLATASKTYAEPLCSDYGRQRSCKRQGCVYVKFKNRENICMRNPSADECESLQIRSRCRETGCKWRRTSKKCLAWDDESDDMSDAESPDDDEMYPIAALPDEIGPIEEEGDSGTVESDRTSEGVDDDADIWGSDRVPRDPAIIDGDDEEENGSIEEEGDSTVTEGDRSREPVDDDRDTWGNDRLPLPENPGIRDGADDEFWESLLGMDVHDAIDEINEGFDFYYNIYICGIPDSSHQCFMRNMDNTRVKLETDDSNAVTSASVG